MPVLRWTPRVRSAMAAACAAVLYLGLSTTAAPAATLNAADGLSSHRPTVSAPARASVARRRTQAATEPATSAAPADPRSGEQWALQGDAPMGLSSAWRQTTGGDVTVAVIDSGADLTHPDLAPNLWVNASEIPGNGIDDDANGYVDDVHGYDFVGADGDPQDENGHGTHVAGIIGARGGNGIGVAGVAWQVRLMILRALDAQAHGTTDAVAKAIHYAVDNGARVVNMSLAGPDSTPSLEAAVQYARAHGVLIVAAAGNDGRDLASAPTYPATYSEDNVLGVAATGEDGRLSVVSDYGPGAEIAAPGERILSTALGGGYEWRTGTSMAAPQVTGALALLASARPDLDGAGLRTALLGGARHDGLPADAGALDVGAALHGVLPASAWKTAPTTVKTSSPRAATRAKATARAKAAIRRAIALRANGPRAIRRHRRSAHRRRHAAGQLSVLSAPR